MDKTTPGPATPLPTIWIRIHHTENVPLAAAPIVLMPSEKVSIKDRCRIAQYEPLEKLAALSVENARLRAALEAAVRLCRCRGTGKCTIDCTLCGDSTYDHMCNDRDVPCENQFCVAARAALAAGGQA